MWVVLAAAAAALLYQGWTLPEPAGPAESAREDIPSWPSLELPSPDATAAFRAAAAADRPSSRRIQDRFRLAGTFFMEGADATRRHAVIDDLDADAQHLVAESDTIAGMLIERIERDVVYVTWNGEAGKLELSFSTPEPPATETAVAEAAAVEEGGGPAWDEVTLEENRFGRRIAAERWILKREELLKYREELLDDPERLAKLFISMKPDRVEGKIDGYRLEMAGEQDFYTAVGFEEGDVVRKVNSMKMTRQERAEYFIREFVNDRLTAVVIDIERGGEPAKLIYYLR